MRWVTIGMLALLALGGCGDDEDDRTTSSSSSSDDEPQTTHMAGGLGWETEEPLVYQQPSNDMRDAQYSVRGHEVVELTVSAFEPHFGGGGTVDGNVDRWIGQIEAPGGQSSREAAEVRTFERNDLRITRVDISGTFVGRRGMNDGMSAHPEWRLLGAIVEGGPDGLVFFKMTGPEAGVTEAVEAFDHMLDSVHLE